MIGVGDALGALRAADVPFIPLRDVGTWYGGGTPSKSMREYWENGDIPWLSPKDMTVDTLTATEDHIAAKALEKSTVRLVPAGSVAFVVRSNVLRRRFPIALVPFAATLNQDMRAVVPRDGIDVGYLALVCRARADAILAVAGRTDGSMAAIQSAGLLDFKIPIPPVATQRALVTILERFGSLQAELESELAAELSARRRQYEYYRDSLLSFREAGGVRWLPMGELATIGTGSHDTQDAIPEGRYVFYARGREPLRLDAFDFDEQAIITAGDGVGVGKVFHFADGKYALHQRAYRIVPNDGLHARYLYHYLVADFARYLERTSVHASVTSLRRPMFLNYPIPVPPLEEQQRVVDVLDKFDALVNDLSVGLPAELRSRRRQYEYYRDKLLAFEESAA